MTEQPDIMTKQTTGPAEEAAVENRQASEGTENIQNIEEIGDSVKADAFSLTWDEADLSRLPWSNSFDKISFRQELERRIDERACRFESYEVTEEDLERIALERQQARDSFVRSRDGNRRSKKKDREEKASLFFIANDNRETELAAAKEPEEIGSLAMEEPALEIIVPEEDMRISPLPAADIQVISLPEEEALPALAEEQAPDQRLDQAIDKCLAGMSRFAGSISGALERPCRKFARKVQSRLAGPLAAAEERGAAFVDRADVQVDRFMDGLTALGLGILRAWNGFRGFSEAHKKPILTGFACCVTVLAFFSISTGSSIAYEYRYNGNLLGVVQDQRDVLEVVSVVGDRLTYVYGAEITIEEEDLTFTEVESKDRQLDSREDVLTALTYMKDMEASGYAIYVGEERKAILESQQAAEDILEAIKAEYAPEVEGREYTSIGFAEDVSIQEVPVRLKNIDNRDKVMEAMMTSGIEQMIYVVESGDTFSEIASNHEIPMSELEALNPEVVPEKLFVGQELILNRMVPLITVQTTEVAVYKEAVAYGIDYEDTSTLYQGEQRVKSSGINGEREVTAEITRENGTEVSRTELNEVILSEPVNQVVLSGTKEIPPLIGTGSFQYPARGKLTSRFGSRWGRQHEGIDIAASYGTAIRAADGGTVIFAGWSNGLGNTVKINHGANLVSVYGHCSKLLVSVGDKVYKDQHIANMGSTGRSTGNHVHFEIRLNGVAQNPLKYLK